MAKRIKKQISERAKKQIANLGKRIKGLREKADYTNYEKFANDKNIGRSQYGKYEQGADMHFSSIMKIIESHDMTVKEFFSKGFE